MQESDDVKTEAGPTVFDLRTYLLGLLKDGLGPGGRLPTERELSHRTGASRRLIRRVLGTLEAEGLVWRRQGKGTFAGPPIEPIDALAAEIGGDADPIEVMEARLCLEPEIAALCATRATPADVSRLWTLARQNYEVEDDEMTELWDSAFHRMIAHCAGNRPLQTAFALLDDTRSGADWQRMRQRARSGRSLQESHDQHLAIVSAIEAGDANAAREAMRLHLLSRVTAMSDALRDFDSTAPVPLHGSG
jgi:GntR family transcriptional repressor for pyruvate dehydrogenase complex